MSRVANLYHSLSDAEVAHLLGPLCLVSHDMRTLVPGDDACLLALTLVEKLDVLNRVTAVASCLGRRCAASALMGFDHVYADLLAGRSDAGAFAVASASDAALLVRWLDRLRRRHRRTSRRSSSAHIAIAAPNRNQPPWLRFSGRRRRALWRTPAADGSQGAERVKLRRRCVGAAC
ncbi:unnamed protein product [Miscanthus lutarioriparius]|uniref:DUF3475 domain-containing protein n=1 Tax=Miscanthus lutarioriparius TaxID=422564 RepID=A0A811RLE9_9POAL|nr:unnamed protein product [Miscanthus lutarioriparius]